MVGEIVGDAVEMVLCVRCSDAVAVGDACPTCGAPDPQRDDRQRLDLQEEELLDRAGAALAGQAALVRRRAAERVDAASRLLADSVALCGRLSRQAVLLRARVNARRALVPDLAKTLARVEEALGESERRHPTGGVWSCEARLPRDKTCLVVARRLLEPYAREELAPCEGEDVMVIVSELAANAFLHGVGAIVLYVHRDRDRLCIEVRDEGRPERIAVVSQQERDGRGRGLWIVEQLAEDWGTCGETSRVWAELVVRGPVHERGISRVFHDQVGVGRDR